MRLSLAISHTPWVPERVDSMARLVDRIDHKSLVAFHVFSDKEPNDVWSGKMWTWASEQNVDWCVFLQDDTVVAPDFVDRLADLLQGAPGDIVGLQVAHPAAPALAAEGYSWFSTSDALVGVGYAIRRSTLKGFLEWRASGLKIGAREALSEDTLLGIYAMTHGARIYHPLPTLVDHDTSLPSSYGNDQHKNRRSRVRWDNAPQVDNRNARVPHVGRFYNATPALAQEYVMGVSSEDVIRWTSDNGAIELRRLSFARRARGVEAKAKILIATPTRGSVHPEYAATIWRLLKDEEIECELLEVSDVQQWQSDVVRIRSRFVNYFLTQTDATHLLFLDDDVSMLPKVLRGMLATGKDFVAAPYPRREGVDFTRIDELKGEVPSEVAAYKYALRLLPNNGTLEIDKDGSAEVEAVPLGCALLSREGLEKVTESFANSDVVFDDQLPNGSRVRCVALFQLVFEHQRDGKVSLLSEDYSFCARWRSSKQKVYMYLGEGSPVTHHGSHDYKGRCESFGLSPRG